ncbi:AlpA family transcriptional regulator [Bradyrhizobium neotropicale]|uniref:helix-turn-helix transcriptional regulator n=1 Tax=Bradyrhizobium neotropicale TaxID=1497615 RepID=UPI001AD64910|nr:hypothetical protein [Bradyrhizobium neotropicale]MBO4228167.1 hypothetical protein [Bradyrhizobium neotropicale]
MKAQLAPRVLTKVEAANYAGCTVSAFSDWVRRGLMPKSLPRTRRWDRKAIDAALDKLSGLEMVAGTDEQSKAEGALQKWERERAAKTTRGKGTQ